MTRAAPALLLGFVLALAAPRPLEGEGTSRPALSGQWGGSHVALQIGEKGANVEFDCAHGSIDQAFVPDADGRFDLAGTFVPEHGGPIRRDEEPPRRPARYAGRVEGDRMELTVTLKGEKEPIGSYTLLREREPRLFKCR